MTAWPTIAKENTAVRLDPALKKALQRAAKAERRTTSWLIHSILEEWWAKTQATKTSQ